jgi:uncharacterized protein YlbG (UPF0298 family)
MSKALYFRVGMDTGVGGRVGPIFEDMSFEYIPIPDLITTEECTYKTCIGRSGKPFSTYIPNALQDQKMHYDPDFRGKPVYGDGSSQKDILLKLNEDDLLVFYAGLTPWKNGKIMDGIDLYWIGYLIVEKAVKTSFKNVLDLPPNAHTKRFEYVQNLAKDIELKFDIDKVSLFETYKCKKIDEEAVEQGLNKINRYSARKKVGHSSIKNLDKRLENILDVNTWTGFVESTEENIVINTYFHLLDLFSKFSLVLGKKDSRLLCKAIKISTRGTNSLGNLDNKISKEWSEILGYPEGKSLQRKSPRWVPNKKYGDKGEFEKLLHILKSSE